jgi:hypothetical protein
MNTKTFFTVLVLSVILVNQVKADRTFTRTPVYSIVSTETVLASTGSTTSTTIPLGLSEYNGIDWELESATTPSVEVRVLQSNSRSGPWVLWSGTSLTDMEFTNNVTITTENDGTDLDLAPSAFAKIELINTDSGDVTITRVGFFNQ